MGACGSQAPRDPRLWALLQLPLVTHTVLPSTRDSSGFLLLSNKNPDCFLAVLPSLPSPPPSLPLVHSAPATWPPCCCFNTLGTVLPWDP